jgi:RHS repeat-associated protein
MKRAAAILAVCASAAWSSGALAGTSITRSSSFAYDPNSGLITQEVVEPNTPSLRLETDTAYDAFGNKTTVTTVGVDITTRSTVTQYDSARGQFVVKNTNALSQFETFVFDARFGKPTSQTGPNGLTTTWTYDVFGRKTLEVRPDGTRTSITYQFCYGVNGGTAYCVSGAAYLVTSTPLASDGVTQNGPIAIVYFDMLDREVGRSTQGFDGTGIYALRQYDALGRVAQTSRPFTYEDPYDGEAAWTVNTYDVLGRVVSSRAPDNSVTQEAYHGLTTVETNALGQTRTVVKNARGDVISVTDAVNNTMTYAYDALGELLQTTDATGKNNVTATYDTRGRKTSSTDPDMGTWLYYYDTLGELVRQIDANGNTTTFTYDLLGRKLRREELDMTSTWTYDTAPHGIGRLASASSTTGYQRTFTYDSLSRPSQTSTNINGSTYNFFATYDSNGHLSKVTYPSGFQAVYSYTALGYCYQLSDGVTNKVHWTLNALDAEQHIIAETAGNNIPTFREFDTNTGRLLAIGAGWSDEVQWLILGYDALGNLTSRADYDTNVTESFVYDGLNRLTQATISTPFSSVKNFTYDRLGNLTMKSDVGNYAYPAPGQAQPHAVMNITSTGMINTTFTYDNNGNQLTGNGRTTYWTSYNKPSRIAQGANNWISFLDGPDHQRFQQVSSTGATTLYFDSFGVHAEYVVNTNTWNEYLTVGNVMVGVRFLNETTEMLTTRYFHADHLGSISAITKEDGSIAERLSYDPWGKRRNINGTDDISGSITSETTRGFTGQEELSVGSLVHLNGRVYDTLIGRMMSADPTVPDPLNPQAWNRYSYVGNDPLTFTDPTGFSWLSHFFHEVGSALHSVFSPAMLRSLAQIVVGTVLSLTGEFWAIALFTAWTSAIMTGIAGGSLGDMLKAGLITAATAFAFNEVGSFTSNPNNYWGSPNFNWANYAENVAGHAAVGCASALASGGSCKAGALSAGAGAAVSPATARAGLVGGTAISGLVGGLAAIAGGGKFQDGAVTAAFGYLFNMALHSTSGGVCTFSITNDCFPGLVGGGGGGMASSSYGPASDPIEDVIGPMIRGLVQGARFIVDSLGQVLDSEASLFRVFGADARALSGSWTTVNPMTVSDYRTAAGLFPGNSGQYMVEGTLTNTEGVTMRSALPGPGQVGGGLPEVVVPNAAGQISIKNFWVVNPPF